MHPTKVAFICHLKQQDGTQTTNSAICLASGLHNPETVYSPKKPWEGVNSAEDKERGPLSLDFNNTCNCIPPILFCPNTNQSLQVSKHSHMPCCLKLACSRTLQTRGHLCSAHTTHQCPSLTRVSILAPHPHCDSPDPPAAFTQLTPQTLYTFLDQKTLFLKPWDVRPHPKRWHCSGGNNDPEHTRHF